MQNNGEQVANGFNALPPRTWCECGNGESSEQYQIQWMSEEEIEELPCRQYD